MILEEIKSRIIKCSDQKYKESPTRKEFLKTNPDLKSDSFREYGGYTNIIKSMGYTIPILPAKEVLNRIEKYIKETGCVPVAVDIRKNNIASQDTLERLGGYEKIIQDLGYEYPKWRAQDYTKDEMKEAFLKIYDKAPSIEDVYADFKSGKLPFNMFVIRTKFDSLNGLVKYAGLEFNQRMLYYYTDAEIIDMFTKRYGTENPPLTDIVNSDFHKGTFDFSANMIQRKYKTYIDFLYLCGYENLNSTFGQKGLSKDNHKCDSKAEIIIDDYFYDNSIGHNSHTAYKKFIPDYERNHKADWMLLDGTVVEYFGLTGNEKYDIKTKAKLDLLKNNNINYIAIYPEDLNSLDILFEEYLIKEAI